ncbi:MAG: biotin/lipoyl-containing protein, partial [Acidimicrobiales bacterium]|nr:biotin/lipoyl-containing protein [Acidimicrobiales bacterium]
MPSEVLCPLQGVVVSIAVELGASVRRGQPVVVIESMKMEHVVDAEEDGVVFGIIVAPGDQVSPGDVLVTLADPATDELFSEL